MVDFSLWDILRNLLLAARWTVVLSIIAFVGGGLVGLGLLLARLARWPGAQVIVAGDVQLFQGAPLLMVTHEINFARKVPDRVVFMHAGRIHEMGPLQQLFAAPQTAELQQFLSALH